MKILYIAEKPIQNSLIYESLCMKETLSVNVLYINKPGFVSLNQNESLNNEAFKDLDYRFDHYNCSFLDDSNNKFKFLAIAIKASSVVVIYGHYSKWLKCAHFLALLFRKQIVVTSDAVSYKGSSETGFVAALFKKFVFRIFYNLIPDCIFVPSQKSYSFFRRLVSKKKLVIITPYCIDERLFVKNQTSDIRQTLGISDDEFVFLFCAKFINRKRPIDVLEAFARLSYRKNKKLIMIGDGPLMYDAKELVTKYAISESVIFMGNVSYNNLFAFYKAANCLVFSSEHEPYGLPVQESLFSGTPVIVSDQVGAANDLIKCGHNGFVYKCGYIDELFNLMELVSNNIGTYNNLLSYITENPLRSQVDINVDAQLAYFNSLKAKF